MRPDRPRFAVDQMLGSLARWLRIMGYDTTYAKERTDTDILTAARSEGRILLTRDVELANRAAPDRLLLESVDLDQQLQQVRAAFGLRADEELARCTTCNGELVPVVKEEVRGKVPEGSFENNDRFYVCARCGKIFWRGAHWQSIRKRLSELQ